MWLLQQTSIIRRKEMIYFQAIKFIKPVFGPGAFVRVFPLNFVFGQAHFEQNYIKFKYIPANNSWHRGERNIPTMFQAF
jgi:hypothetical protein